MYRHLGSALLLATSAAACATTGSVPRPFPGATVPGIATTAPAPDAPAPVSPAGEGAPAIPASIVPVGTPLLVTALSYRGVPYRNGGSDPAGFDCSGFVQWVFAQHGRALPREVRDQYQLGAKVDRDEIRPGDLVFFETVSHGASHVGIALGGDEFIHAPSSNGVVRVERYSIDYWKRRYVGARRLDN